MTDPPARAADVFEQRPSLFEGDHGTLEADVREVISVLMAKRVFLGRTDPQLWETLLEHQQAITTHFHNMYVDLVIDRANGLAFKRQIHPEGVGYRVLLRDQRATREMSVAVLYLRDQYNKQVRSGIDRATVTRADLHAEMEAYWPDTETNRKARTGNAHRAIQSLLTQDLLIGNTEAEEWEISPAVQALFTADAINRLTDWLTDPSRRSAGDDAEGESE